MHQLKPHGLVDLERHASTLKASQTSARNSRHILAVHAQVAEEPEATQQGAAVPLCGRAAVVHREGAVLRQPQKEREPRASNAVRVLEERASKRYQLIT